MQFLTVKSLSPGRCGCDFELQIFKLISSSIGILSIFCKITPRWMPQDFTDAKSTLGWGI